MYVVECTQIAGLLNFAWVETMPLISVSHKQLCKYRWDNLVLLVANNQQFIVFLSVKNQLGQSTAGFTHFIFFTILCVSNADIDIERYGERTLLLLCYYCIPVRGASSRVLVWCMLSHCHGLLRHTQQRRLFILTFQYNPQDYFINQHPQWWQKILHTGAFSVLISKRSGHGLKHVVDIVKQSKFKNYHLTIRRRLQFGLKSVHLLR